MTNTEDNFNYKDENLIKERLQESAAQIRAKYLKREYPHSNVAIAEINIQSNIIFCVGATAKGGKKSPIPQKPQLKSKGGQFEPTIDPYSGHLMDTDSEYKVLSEIAETLEKSYNIHVQGNIYLYTERQPCQSCEGVIKQFQDKFANLNLEVFWNYPYPPVQS
ncbi:deaminase domain-containing protein [Okeanomitos corallinicola TIOX110]|uniref:Deaminase domain-containing protein n=1 Tax=Okeanomitos corallinicola TIOX110 TaxID=3133117 RepID=A0ABZ2UQF1_9CYAN